MGFARHVQDWINFSDSIREQVYFTKMLKDVGMEVPKSIETRSKFSMHGDKGRG